MDAPLYARGQVDELVDDPTEGSHVEGGVVEHPTADDFDQLHKTGYTPVEMTGHVEFPSIGQLPYLLTLPGHGFDWFELRPSEERL